MYAVSTLNLSRTVATESRYLQALCLVKKVSA